MARDYAKRFYIDSNKKRSNTRWFVLAGIIIVVSLGLFFKFKSNKIFSENSSTATLFAHIKSIFVKKAPVATANKLSKQNDAPEPQVRFSFYNELPNMHVEVLSPQQTNKVAIGNAVMITSPGHTVQSNLAKVEPKDKKRSTVEPAYYLQFGTFKDAPSASQLRLSLLLTGIESEVEKVENGPEKNYRVWQGSYATEAQAKQYQQKWRRKGVESVIKQDG